MNTICKVYLPNNSLYYGKFLTISDIYLRSKLDIYPY